MRRIPIRMMTTAPTRVGATPVALAALALVALSGGSSPVAADDVLAPDAARAPAFVQATANTGNARVVTPSVRQHEPSYSPSGSPRQIGQALAVRRGWTGSQWTCLDKLWTRESGWRVHESNSVSGAFGIPQALPGRKMASYGGDWRDNAVTQIRWGLAYIADRYGAPCDAWQHSQAHNYY